MGRPQKVIQQKKNGIYFVQLHLNGRRVTRSLETRDTVKATARAAQAIRELQEEADRQGQSKWAADTPGIEWDVPVEMLDHTLPGPRVKTKRPPITKATQHEVVPSQILEPEHLKDLDWRDLVKEAVRVRQRKTGEDYSEGWYVSARQAINRVPFTLQQATPEAIRDWMVSMEREGLGPRSIQLHCTTLCNLINRAQLSGLLAKLEVNPFSKVDYSTEVEPKHIPPFLEPDYLKLKEVLPQLSKSQRLLMLLMAYTGTRFSEYERRGAEAFDLEAGTVSFTEGKVKNESSARTVPLPAFLVEELKQSDFKWNSRSSINKKLKLVNPTLSTHSFRHGLVRAGRDVGAAPDPIEVYVGHKLKGMKATYGDGYGIDALREAMEPVWQQLDQWLR